MPTSSSVDDLLLMPASAGAVRIPAEVRWKDKDRFSVFVHDNVGTVGVVRAEGMQFGDAGIDSSEDLNKVGSTQLRMSFLSILESFACVVCVKCGPVLV